eukprot:7363812-Pyramimonas_sp.AAC.1
MEHDWHGQLAMKTALKLGHPNAQLDVAAARSALASDLLGHQKGTLLAFLTQNIWTMERAKAAGYDVPVECQCGHPSDSLGHRLLHCPKRVTHRATHFSDAELLRLREHPPQATPLQLGFQLVPEFRREPPPGTGFDFGKRWCAQTGLTPQEAFSEGE